MSPHPLTDDDLKKAFQDHPPPTPSKTGRKRAIDAGLAEFDRLTEKKFQGSRARHRPTPITRHFFMKMGEWMMNSKTLTTAGALGACAMLALFIVNQQPQGMIPSPFTRLSDPLVKAEKKTADDGGMIVATNRPAPALEPGSALMAESAFKETTPQAYSEPVKDRPRPEAEMDATAEMAPPPPPVAMKPTAPHVGPAGIQRLARQASPTMSFADVSRERRAAPARHKMKSQAMPVIGGDAGISMGDIITPPPDLERDQHQSFENNPVKLVTEQPVSTFSVDVDSASYSFVRRRINSGRLPAPNAVRVEEMINYFDYDYAVPTDRSKPFQPNVALYPTPWNPNSRLLHIGIKGYAPAENKKPASNLVFLLDVSGSMSSRDKLPLLKQSMRLLVNTLDADDTVAIVVYAGAAGTVLEPTPVKERHKILAALDKLQAGGSTAGGAGIELAYSLAAGTYQKNAVNRVILATDGDFNVGVANHEALKGLIARKRKSGIFLSVLGFGRGNYNDRLMQTLAQNGNGIAAYIDTLNEARKVLVEEASANLFPIAKDVKIQVEFNPKRVAEYRLIGYETRRLNREDFNNDQVDAGDIGAGHTVTALYEIVPAGSAARQVDELRYQKPAPAPTTLDKTAEFAFLKLRYKLPDESNSRLMTRAITDADLRQDAAAVTDDYRFAAAVAAFGQSLRGGQYLKNFDYPQMITLAQGAKGADPFGYRAEFINLVRLAAALDNQPKKSAE